MNNSEYNFVHIKYSAKSQNINTKQICWYDPLFKKLLKFNCHKLQFKIILQKFAQKIDGQIVDIDQAVKQFKKQFPNQYLSDVSIINHLIQNGIIQQQNRLFPQPVTYRSKNKTNEHEVNQIIESLDFQFDVQTRNNKGILLKINQNNIPEFEQLLKTKNVSYSIY